jgi:di/tricarboxylate transporter
MTAAQLQILSVLGGTIVLFLWGRWRHDLVALAALLACVLLGLVGAQTAFSGFGHPAVITVACVLVLSQGLQDTGAVDRLARRMLPKELGAFSGIAALAGLGAVLSAFMNNVGAMALLLPIGLQLAARLDLPPSRILMPLSFGTILGGMTTLIGTPPNLIVSGFRAEQTGEAFGMFDFTPVGGAVALLGLAFLVLLGWRLVPARRAASEAFETGAYLVEAGVGNESTSVGKTVREAEQLLEAVGAQIIGLVRNDTRLHAPLPRRRIRPGDVLVIEAAPDDLAAALTRLDLTLGEEKDDEQQQEKGRKTLRDAADGETAEGRESGEPLLVQEFVVLPASGLTGRSAGGVGMASRYGINLLAVSREGSRSIRRLRTMRFKDGDLLLLQGSPEALSGFAGEHRLVPLASRDIRLPQPRKALIAAVIMAAAIAAAAFGLLSAAVAFAAGVLAMAVFDIIPVRNLYRAVDWPVVVLLAALIPVAGAMSSTGTADLIASVLLDAVAGGSAVIALGLILVVTMTLSDFMNNAATAAVMCPIAISSAEQLGVASDPLLMAVAIGASCAFLTPIGHQNNTLILGPAGLKFADYWRLGLPMEIVVVAVSIPTLLWIWPLN